MFYLTVWQFDLTMFEFIDANNKCDLSLPRVWSHKTVHMNEALNLCTSCSNDDINSCNTLIFNRMASKVLRNSNKQEAWQTFKTQDGRIVQEKVTVTDNTVNIEVPNEMKVIYDYKHVSSCSNVLRITKGFKTPVYFHAIYIGLFLCAIPYYKILDYHPNDNT